MLSSNHCCNGKNKLNLQRSLSRILSRLLHVGSSPPLSRQLFLDIRKLYKNLVFLFLCFYWSGNFEQHELIRVE